MLASGPPIASGYRGGNRITTLRNIMVTMNKLLKTKMNKINKTQQKMVGPLMWQPIDKPR